MITLDTIATATEQEIYDQVKQHLLNQGCKSEDSASCMYRDVNGNKCAAGCLMSDDEYTAQFEGNSWHDLIIDRKVTSVHAGLIAKLQDVHDRRSVNSWSRELKKVAVAHNLIP